MALSDDIRAELTQIEARMADLKHKVKQASKTRDPISPMLTELKELHVRQTELQENLARLEDH